MNQELHYKLVSIVSNNELIRQWLKEEFDRNNKYDLYIEYYNNGKF